ncbi:MAG: NUDIX hydrolase [Armatimonadetes bacterium]|jgi:ADP-ribose pyrophosphatase|nr:NUDIX hydrolase [Armatimonadota bacterium]
MSRFEERTLQTERIYEGRILSLRLDTVLLPNGKEGRREIVEHNGSVVVIPTDGEAVYFVNQYRHATGLTLLELPAGSVEAGEDYTVCAERECEEETGFRPGKVTYLCEGYVSPGYTSELQKYYLAEHLTPVTAEHDEDEFIDVVRIPWEEALRKVDAGEFLDTKSVAGLLMAARRLGLR